MVNFNSLIKAALACAAAASRDGVHPGSENEAANPGMPPWQPVSGNVRSTADAEANPFLSEGYQRTFLNSFLPEYGGGKPVNQLRPFDRISAFRRYAQYGLQPEVAQVATTRHTGLDHPLPDEVRRKVAAFARLSASRVSAGLPRVRRAPKVPHGRVRETFSRGTSAAAQQALYGNDASASSVWRPERYPTAGEMIAERAYRFRMEELVHQARAGLRLLDLNWDGSRLHPDMPLMKQIITRCVTRRSEGPLPAGVRLKGWITRKNSQTGRVTWEFDEGNGSGATCSGSGSASGSSASTSGSPPVGRHPAAIRAANPELGSDDWFDGTCPSSLMDEALRNIFRFARDREDYIDAVIGRIFVQHAGVKWDAIEYLRTERRDVSSDFHSEDLQGGAMIYDLTLGRGPDGVAHPGRKNARYVDRDAIWRACDDHEWNYKTKNEDRTQPVEAADGDRVQPNFYWTAATGPPSQNFLLRRGVSKAAADFASGARSRAPFGASDASAWPGAPPALGAFHNDTDGWTKKARDLTHADRFRFLEEVSRTIASNVGQDLRTHSNAVDDGDAERFRDFFQHPLRPRTLRQLAVFARLFFLELHEVQAAEDRAPDDAIVGLESTEFLGAAATLAHRARRFHWDRFHRQIHNGLHDLDIDFDGERVHAKEPLAWRSGCVRSPQIWPYTAQLNNSIRQAAQTQLRRDLRACLGGRAGRVRKAARKILGYALARNTYLSSVVDDIVEKSAFDSEQYPWFGAPCRMQTKGLFESACDVRLACLVGDGAEAAQGQSNPRRVAPDLLVTPSEMAAYCDAHEEGIAADRRSRLGHKVDTHIACACKLVFVMLTTLNGALLAMAGNNTQLGAMVAILATLYPLLETPA